MRMLHRCRNDWLGPLRNIAQLAPAHDLAALRVEDQYRLWSSARVWIGFFAVVVHLEFSQHRDKLDQVHETSVILLKPTYNMRTSSPLDSASCRIPVIVFPPSVVSKAK